MTTTFSDSGEARYTFVSQGTSSELRVTRLSGYEGVSDLFRFGIELASTDDQIDLEAVVGIPARLDFLYEDGSRPVFGIVSRFEQSVAGETFTPYFAELVPSVWMLTQRVGSRIFQSKTTQQIIEQILGDAGIDSGYYRFALQGTYHPREYCVQYRESEWNFIARLMEEEGIFFFFEHADDKDILVMADSSDAHVDIEGDPEVVFRDPSGAVAEEEYIYDFRYSQQIRPGAVQLTDYNFTDPGNALNSLGFEINHQELAIYEHRALFGIDFSESQPPWDQRLENIQTIRLEETQTRRLLGRGSSLCRRMIPGYKFNLAEFTRDDLNQSYLLIGIQHEGVQPLGQDDAGGQYRYNNHFRCIPATVPFRPIRKTPKPRVEGTQTAFVTGPAGEEIYVDQYGRVKVQFHWDMEGTHDENSSCWIRVSQLWAGVGWGAMFIPRIGHEVIVDFIEGDPDRPIITGRVYHALNTVPYPLDDEKTKSTIKSESTLGGGGSNEIRFEDLKGSEEIYVHAQKDQNEVVENDESTTIGHDHTHKVGNNQTITVKKDRTITVEEGNLKTTVIQGTSTTTVKGDTTLTVQAGNNTISVTGDMTTTVSGAISMTAKGGGVGIKGSGEGVTIAGDGGVGVGIKASPDFKATASGQVQISSPMSFLGDDYVCIYGTEIVLDGGGGKIILDASGVTISGPKIDAAATGLTTISGSIVKLNC